MQEGSRGRATAATALNASSSRSHALLSVRVSCTHADGRTVESLLHLVDLAGKRWVAVVEAVQPMLLLQPMHGCRYHA